MKILRLVLLVLSIFLISVSVFADDCATIQDGTIRSSSGDVIDVGFDTWGYNYQALLFNGNYCDSYQNAPWCQAYADVHLSMKWNEAWLSNKDCDGDNLLDRHLGFPSYKGSGAWLTNHMTGDYRDGNRLCKWTTFTKIVAVPETAYLVAGVWYDQGEEIGPAIWGEFATVLDIYNDSCAGTNGLSLKMPRPGLGNW